MSTQYHPLHKWHNKHLTSNGTSSTENKVCLIYQDVNININFNKCSAVSQSNSPQLQVCKNYIHIFCQPVVETCSVHTVHISENIQSLASYDKITIGLVPSFQRTRCGINMFNLLGLHEALKHNFTSLEADLIFLTKIPLKLVYQHIAIFFNF